MRTNVVMTYILIGILMVCGYIFLLQIVAGRTTNRAALPLISVLLLGLYVIIGIPFLLIIFSLGNLEFVLLALLSVVSCIILFATLSAFFRNFRWMNKGMLVLFLTYTFAVLYITIFSRGEGTNDTTVYLVQTDVIREAMRNHSLEPLNHMLLNLALFIPMGFLLPCTYPEKLSSWIYALLMGLMCTTIIEATQLLLRIGQADLTDVITNTLGALIGYAAYRIMSHFSPAMSSE